MISIQCSRLQPQSLPRYGSGTGSMPFPQAPARARRILGRWRWSGLLWCCGWSCWWCSRGMTKRSSPVGSSRGRRGPMREGYKVVALLLKPSLGLFELVGRRRVLLPHPEFATGHLIAPGGHHTLQHISVHFGVDLQADFEDVRWHDVALTWNHTKDHNRSRKLCFYPPGHIELSGFAFWGCWQWSCYHNLDRLRALVVQRRISNLARWTLCHFQTW